VNSSVKSPETARRGKNATIPYQTIGRNFTPLEVNRLVLFTGFSSALKLIEALETIAMIH